MATAAAALTARALAPLAGQVAQVAQVLQTVAATGGVMTFVVYAAEPGHVVTAVTSVPAPDDALAQFLSVANFIYVTLVASQADH